ncbi:MAG: response regulator, partial [Planctomycetota bacterium]
NLCSNAAHAMRESGGILDVSLEAVELKAKDMASHPKLICPGPYVLLTVSDTGHGIKLLFLNRIFDPYFTSKEPGEGTGLGLAVVQGIVHNHNGEILVKSEPGKRTTFEVYLPRITEEAAPDIEVTRLIPHGNERILWVDDEQTLVNMGKQILKRLGYRVFATVSSSRALSTFRKSPQKFDLVITDQTMPGLTGVELIKGLREIRSDIPVILVSGYSEVVCEKSAHQLGVQEFIMKPFETYQIAETIRKALDGVKVMEEP